MPATDARFRVIGEVSDEVRTLAEERKRIWNKVGNAGTEEECRAGVRALEAITDHINFLLKRDLVD